MIKNYIKIAWRNIWKHKSFSIINIVGLALSMSVCLLIIMIVIDQYSFDSYQSKGDQVYRIHSGRPNQNGFEMASSAIPLAEKLKAEYPYIDEAVCLKGRIGGEVSFDNKFVSGGGYFTDNALFQILDYDFKEGDPNTALNKPFSLVITKELADHLFPNGAALGKTVEFHDKGIQASGLGEGNIEQDYGSFTITGVLNPLPGKTHLPFKILASSSTMPALMKDSLLSYNENDWQSIWDSYTYVLLNKSHHKTDLQSSLDRISSEVYKGKADVFSYKAVSLKEISPSGMVGNLTHVSLPKIGLIILSLLGFIVMISACINYTNLSLARSLSRLKEVGVRKVVGAQKRQIFSQFIIEAIVLSLIALLFAYIILTFLKNAFATLMINDFLNISFQENISILIVFIGFSMLVGIIAGLLPSVYVSGMSPINLFRNTGVFQSMKRLGLRKTLVVIQYSVSMIFIVSILVIYGQSKHLINTDLGFDKEDVITVKLYDYENYDRLKNEIATVIGADNIGAVSLLPAGHDVRGTTIQKSQSSKYINVNTFETNKSAMNLLNIEIIAGTNLLEYNNDSKILINESTLKQLNLNSPKEAIGQTVLMGKNSKQIIGVVKDFYFLGATQAISPLVIFNNELAYSYALVKCLPGQTQKTIELLRSTWKKVNPQTSFVYSFLEEEISLTKKIFLDLLFIIGTLSFLAIIISLLGMYGMMAYTAETKVKEVGIRKTLGSSIHQLMMLLSKGYLTLIFISMIFSIPLAIFINNFWLENFANRIAVSASIILTGIGSIVVISCIMILHQAYRAAVENPIKSLRNE